MSVRTLDAASRLASQGKDLGFAAATMLMFGLGAPAPLLLVGAVSRSTLAEPRGGLGHAGRWGQTLAWRRHARSRRARGQRDRHAA